jgi:hypothetical protein
MHEIISCCRAVASAWAWARPASVRDGPGYSRDTGTSTFQAGTPTPARSFRLAHPPQVCDSEDCDAAHSLASAPAGASRRSSLFLRVGGAPVHRASHSDRTARSATKQMSDGARVIPPANSTGAGSPGLLLSWFIVKQLNERRTRKAAPRAICGASSRAYPPPPLPLHVSTSPSAAPPIELARDTW